MNVVLFEFQAADFSTLNVLSFIFKVLICELFPCMVALEAENCSRLCLTVLSEMENRYSYRGVRGLGVPRVVMGN